MNRTSNYVNSSWGHEKLQNADNIFENFFVTTTTTTTIYPYSPSTLTTTTTSTGAKQQILIITSRCHIPVSDPVSYPDITSRCRIPVSYPGVISRVAHCYPFFLQQVNQE
ncbi:hypothetical protein DINM_005591 [Dirofilaria immitis]|nr:hypothetical protein [Dirofilaria immitis]